MTRILRLGIVALTLVFGMGTVSVSWADDQAGGQAKAKKRQMDKGKGKDQSKKEPNAGGPMGESDTGGAGPSGPAPLPPGKAPGFEGAGKDKSRSPSAGGPQ